MFGRKLLSGILAAVLTVASVLSLSGCSNRMQTEMPETGTLNVSYLSRHKNIDGVMLNLAKQEFEESHIGWTVEIDEITKGESDYEDRVQKLLNNMMVGKGPDVLFVNLNFCNEADVNKICRSGKLVDLTPYFAADESWSWDGYNTAVIDSLKMDGKQVLMPLSYNMPFFITDETVLQESGIDLDACKTGKGLIEQFIAYNERAREDQSMPMLFDDYGYTLYSQLFDIMQMNPLDYDAGKVNWDENTREMLELYKQLYPVDTGKEVINPSYISNDKGNYACILDGDYLMPLRLDYWNEQIIQLFSLENAGKAAILPIYNYDGSGIAVEMNTAAGVLGSSQKKGAAVEFVKTLLGETAQSQSTTHKIALGDDTMSYGISGSMPVLEKGINDMWDTAVQSCKSWWQLNEGSAYIEEGLSFDHAPDDVLQQILDLSHQITSCYIRNRSDNGNLSEYFKEYFEDKVSYEKAFDKADNTLNIYASE